MTPPRPSYTLFPYTTLFRSHRVRRDGAAEGDIRRPRPSDGIRLRRDGPADAGHLRGLDLRGIDVRQRGAAADVEGPHGPGDRKSTRLNSSHLVLSYAVFCLK